jgi:hypothetical protein
VVEPTDQFSNNIKNHLKPNLKQPRRRGTHHLAKRSAADVPVHRRRVVELRMIEVSKASNHNSSENTEAFR